MVIYWYRFSTFVLRKDDKTMKKTIFSALFFMLLSTVCFAQEERKPFRANIYNDEYEVYLRINLYDQDVTIPGQDLYGELPGYLGKKNNSFCWVIANCKVKSDKEAELQLINDFGSEDLTATLIQKNDSTYILRQDEGNTLKVPRKGKWAKLPKTLEFKRNIH